MKLHRNCEGNHPDVLNALSRRDFMHIGMVGTLGLSLPNMLRLKASAIPSVESFTALAASVIHICLPGGMAQHGSWDPKPFASPDYRGPYTPIKTSVPGEYVGEKFVNIAKIMDKLSVVRSMTHGEAAHERGTHNMFTGYRPSPAVKFPSYGSIISHEQGSRNNLPPYVVVPSQSIPEQGTGYMSSAFGPFALGSDPADKGFAVRDLLAPKDVTTQRFDRRRSMLAAVDEHFRATEKSDAIGAMDSFQQAAYGLVSSAKAREAFDLSKVLDKLRDEYRIKRMTKVRADTIEELATKLEGVDPTAFLKTIKEWNEAVMTEVPFMSAKPSRISTLIGCNPSISKTSLVDFLSPL